jgi:molybdopterin synthase sulfurtransferase
MSALIRPATITRDLLNGRFLLLDCRPSAAYNGWPLEGESRGGHIPGAISFPAQWFDGLEDAAAATLLFNKGIDPATPLVLVGNADEMSKAAAHLQKLGYMSIGQVDGGMVAWLSESENSVLKLSRYKHLVHPDWLARIVEGNAPEPGVGKAVLAHVSFDNWGDYDAGHIPGAIWLDSLALEDEYTWNSRSAAELEEELRAHGITKETTVVLYGRTSDPNMKQAHPGKQAGQLASMRAALLLMHAGVQDVRVLDGGLGAWLRAGGSITRKEFASNPVKDSGLRIPEHPKFIASIDEAKELIAGSISELVSVRSWAEFIGEVSGYHYIEAKGRIPGAVFGNCGSDAYHMETYRNHDDTMRSFHEIDALLRDAGITPDKRIAFYCGTGWRASEAFFYAWLMGWPDVAIFDGGWFEWSNDSANPRESGLPA